MFLNVCKQIFCISHVRISQNVNVVFIRCDMLGVVYTRYFTLGWNIFCLHASFTLGWNLYIFTLRGNEILFSVYFTTKNIVFTLGWIKFSVYMLKTAYFTPGWNFPTVFKTGVKWGQGETSPRLLRWTI